MTNEQIKELKTKFAAEWLKTPEQPYEAAFRVIADTGEALKAAYLWVNDVFVAEEKIRLLGTVGQQAFLPGKDEQMLDIWKMCTNEKLDVQTRLKAHELYARIRVDYFEKPAQMIGNQTNIQNNGVMVLRDKGSDAEWESLCKRQQTDLVLNAC